jgi:hypothetical protein
VSAALTYFKVSTTVKLPIAMYSNNRRSSDRFTKGKTSPPRSLSGAEETETYLEEA